MQAVAERVVTVTDLVAALRLQQRPVPAAFPPVAERSSDLGPRVDVAVLAAHPGAGASAVAVAILDALLARGESDVTLVDLAPVNVSGLLAASEREVDSGHPAWRGGRRGRALILRPRQQDSVTIDLASVLPRPGKTITDGAPPQRTPGTQIVLVCRGTVPGVRRAEAALQTFSDAAAVAVVGVRRWPKTVSASIGPALSTLAECGRVAFIPSSPTLEVNGVDAQPSPTGIVAAATRLVELLWPEQVAHTSFRSRGLHR